MNPLFAVRGFLFGARARPARIALFVALTAAVAWLALSPTPPRGVDTGWDKANHALAFAVMLVSGRLAWPPRPWTVALGLLGYGLLIELVQSHVPGREASALDVIADAAGIAIGAALGVLLLRASAARRG